MHQTSLFFFFIFIFLVNLFAKDLQTYQTVQAEPDAPVIDGRLVDDCWMNAPLDSHFIQRNPIEGEKPSERTEFQIVYDSENIYVGFRCYDSEAHLIEKRVSRRDQTEDVDLISILLDSYFDRRTAFQFLVTPGGVKYDAIISEDGLQEDESWNAVWNAAVTIDDSGWVAEMKIPFSQLRFPNKQQHKWGVQIFRKIYRKQEELYWTHVPKDAPGFVSLFGILNGLKDISLPSRLEILPYSVTKLNTYPSEEDNPFATGRDWDLSGGIDGKWRATSDLTMDFTINPDFGQVEADPSEMNLTAYETFFEEKRPFFVEGKNIFNYQLALGGVEFARETLFYSRRIGRTPHHSPELQNGEYERSPEWTTILGAAKLSGKTSNGWSLGAIDAITAEEKADIDGENSKRKETVEPTTNYLVGRLQKDFNAGNTLIGGMVTATNRSIDKEYLNYLPKSAYSGGIDFLHQWDNKSYFLDFKFALSHVQGHKDAILDLQTNSARYYQRPDASHLSLDSSRTHLTGHGGTLNFGKVAGGRWRFGFGSLWRSPGLELNDVGYLREADQLIEFIWLGYRITDPMGIFRIIEFNLAQWNVWTFGGEKLATGGNISYSAQFLNYWELNLGIMREQEALSVSELRGGPALRIPGVYRASLSIGTDPRKKWQIKLNSFNVLFDDDNGLNSSVSLDLSLKPSSRFNIMISPFYSYNLDNLQYVESVDYNDDTRHIFAKINQNTFGLTLRLNYSITPDFSIQYYGQPFISAGNYTNFKKITRPGAKHYNDRFEDFSDDALKLTLQEEDQIYEVYETGNVDYSFEKPDFNFKQFRSNFVIRWEYRPGSQLYFVWSQGRTGSENYGDFNFTQNLKDVFRIDPDNIFLIKFNYWLSI